MALKRSRTFLELSRAFAIEVGEGSGPSSVLGQTGQQANIVTWIAAADMYIRSLWIDWKFAWAKKEDLTLLEGQNEITSIDDFETEVENSLILNHGTAAAHRPQWMQWRDFEARFGVRPIRSGPRPGYWTVRPDGVIVLSEKVSTDTPWSIEYYKTPTRLAANGDTSPIPQRFDRIIIARAGIIYGTREDAPELVAGYSAEYEDFLDKLEGFYLPGQRGSRRSQNNGHPEPDFLGGTGRGTQRRPTFEV